MAKVAEGIARVADGIVTGRRQRSELAVEIRNAARSRRGEVRSLLESLKASRGRASRELATEITKVTRTRHGEVVSFLAAAQASRGSASQAYRREAVVVTSGRRREIKALLTQFGRELSARRQRRLEFAAAQHDKAAAFMRDLTSGVAALRDGFAKENRDRAAAIRERLGAYALDRRNAVAAWGGSLHEKRTVVQSAGASHHLAAASPAVHAGLSVPPSGPAKAASPAVHAEPPVPPSGPAKADAPSADAAQSPDQHQTQRSGRRLFGHGGSNERQGGDSK